MGQHIGGPARQSAVNILDALQREGQGIRDADRRRDGQQDDPEDGHAIGGDGAEEGHDGGIHDGARINEYLPAAESGRASGVWVSRHAWPPT
jgi:hypothetical protein